MTTSSQAADAGSALEAVGGIAAERYSAPAVLLHWVIALLILAGLPLGLYMVGLPVSPSKLKYYSWHKWIGVTVFMLALARLAWRAGHRPPAPLPGQPRWQLAVAHAMHGVLYLMMIAIPLTGWLFSSAAGFPTVYLGLIQLPDLVHKDAQLKEIFKLAHLVLTYALGGLVVLHAAAAIKHAVVDRDATMSRMWLGRAANNEQRTNKGFPG